MKQPTEKIIIERDDTQEYIREGFQWYRDLKRNENLIKERKEKGNKFREWHKNNKNKNVVEYYELVKKQRSTQDSDSRKSAEFWL